MKQRNGVAAWKIPALFLSFGFTAGADSECPGSFDYFPSVQSTTVKGEYYGACRSCPSSTRNAPESTADPGKDFNVTFEVETVDTIDPSDAYAVVSVGYNRWV